MGWQSQRHPKGGPSAEGGCHVFAKSTAEAVRARLLRATKSPHNLVGASLPLVDTFRTFCVAPTPEVKVVFDGLRLVAA